MTNEYTVMRDFHDGGNSMTGLTTTKHWYHLDMLTIEDKFNPKKSVYESLFTLARAELYCSSTSMGNASYFGSGDFTNMYFQDDFLNGKKGNIKNIIQFLNAEISKNKTRKLHQELAGTKELLRLKKDTLYIPNYWYGAKGTMLKDQQETSADYLATVKYLDKALKSYPYKIKMISRDELDKLILTASGDFYYINYIQTSTDKIVSIVNGLNGNLVYSVTTNKSYRIKDNDFEKIGKAIQ